MQTNEHSLSRSDYADNFVLPFHISSTYFFRLLLSLPQNYKCLRGLRCTSQVCQVRHNTRYQNHRTEVNQSIKVLRRNQTVQLGVMKSLFRLFFKLSFWPVDINNVIQPSWKLTFYWTTFLNSGVLCYHPWPIKQFAIMISHGDRNIYNL